LSRAGAKRRKEIEMNEKLQRAIEKAFDVIGLLQFEPDGNATVEDFEGVSLACRAYRVWKPSQEWGMSGEWVRVWVHGQDWGRL
jgi:hypothetical protein